MLAWLRDLFQPKPKAPIHDLDGLGEFIAAHSAFISQKATLDYCRARAGVMWIKLFEDERFRDALDYCRWESYAAVLADVCEVTQIYLRRREVPEAPLPELLTRLARGALLRYPIPAHRRDWEDRLEALNRRLERANLAQPRPVHMVGYACGEAVFELLPIHTNLREHDREHVVNNLRFFLVQYHVELERLARPEALRAAVLRELPPSVSQS